MSDLLNVSSNPHVRDKNSTSSIMLDVIIALLPTTFLEYLILDIEHF